MLMIVRTVGRTIRSLERIVLLCYCNVLSSLPRTDRRWDNSEVGMTRVLLRRLWHPNDDLVRSGLVPSICNSNELPAVPSSTVTPIGMKGGVSKFRWIKFIQPHCNRIHKNGKQVAVYLATTKNRFKGISKTLLIHRYNTTSLYIPRSERRERELQWRFIITVRSQSLKGTPVNHKDYYLDQ